MHVAMVKHVIYRSPVLTLAFYWPTPCAAEVAPRSSHGSADARANRRCTSSDSQSQAIASGRVATIGGQALFSP